MIIFCGALLAGADFAERLESMGEFKRAAVEYLRYAHANPAAADKQLALFKSGRCFEKAKDFRTAKLLYLELNGPDVPVDLVEAARYRVVLSDFFIGDLNTAIRQAEADSGSEEYLRASRYLRGWIYFYSREYSVSLGVFGDLKPEYYDSSVVFMIERSEDGLDLARRSPALAASMSAVLPGSGRAYCGRWGDALVSLIAVGGTIGGAIALWDDDRSFAIGLGVTGAFFYGGNVYGSWAGANWFNEERHRELYRYARQDVNRRPEELYDF